MRAGVGSSLGGYKPIIQGPFHSFGVTNQLLTDFARISIQIEVPGPYIQVQSSSFGKIAQRILLKRFLVYSENFEYLNSELGPSI